MTPYDRDLYTWSLEQAALLRRARPQFISPDFWSDAEQ